MYLEQARWNTIGSEKTNKSKQTQTGFYLPALNSPAYLLWKI